MGTISTARHRKAINAWEDEYTYCVGETCPMAPDQFNWAGKKKPTHVSYFVQTLARMMHAYQAYHFDMAPVFALSAKEWAGWCMQWNMYKRDLAMGYTHSLIPSEGVRHEAVCPYLETPLRWRLLKLLCRQ